MKTQFIPRMLVILILLGTIIVADAQPIAMSYTPDKYTAYLKDNNIVHVPSLVTKSDMLNNINIHALRDFMLKYNEVSNASWFGVEGGFVAKFTANEATTTVTYKKNGKWLYTISSYDEMKMPKDVRALVKSTYYDYNIIIIEEIQVPQNDNNIYLIKVLDAKTIKILRVSEGEMQVLYDYIRG